MSETRKKTGPQKDRRIYAAAEAQKMPCGGKSYIADLFGCARKRIYRGLSELEEPETLPAGRIRREGAGRKECLETIENIDEVFLEVVDDFTAGDPMRSDIGWTNPGRQAIADRMEEKGVKISVTVVDRLLKSTVSSGERSRKDRTCGKVRKSKRTIRKYSQAEKGIRGSRQPGLKRGHKKKEKLGNLYRDGKVYAAESIRVYDHDFPHLADGVAIPYTLYDYFRNEAYVSIGTSKDTSEFVCDSIKSWWEGPGRENYPDAMSILFLADGGGSNSSRHYIFKEDLQKLVDDIGIEIRVAHYPPYTSKWNPVEHRVFPHITRSLSGVVLRSHEFIKELIENTTTKTGLKAHAQIVKKVYETGRKYADDFKENMKIVFDEFLGQWNYRAVPSTL